MQIDDLIKEASSAMTICNSCRYCEGYCAVFPAMERRLQFTAGDLRYLSNLCHNCGECYYACQYAPPHEFAVSVPHTFAKLRNESYGYYAWPRPLAKLLGKSGLLASLGIALALTIALLGIIAIWGDWDAMFTAHRSGNFYAVMPHNVMASIFGAVGLFVLLAFTVGFFRFWRDASEQVDGLKSLGSWSEALSDAFQLKYLHGQGETGCTYPDEVQSHLRKWFHHFTFYGFMLCFAATLAGTIYHYVFHLPAPYGYTSLPVILGTVGGIGLLIGSAGLLWLKRRRDPNTADMSRSGGEIAFIVQLFLVSLTGLLLLMARETSGMGLLLVIHLGIVMALFVTMPYGKFVHGIYRVAALLKYALESKRPALNVGGE
jgi:citrate/tricarballylate utilization protein